MKNNNIQNTRYNHLTLTLLHQICRYTCSIYWLVTICQGKLSDSQDMNIFPCIRVLRLEDINLAGMDRVYYYSRMTKQCIEKKNHILTIREFSLKYRHQPIYGTYLMTKVMKKSQCQMIVPCILKIYFCHI